MNLRSPLSTAGRHLAPTNVGLNRLRLISRRPPRTGVSSADEEGFDRAVEFAVQTSCYWRLSYASFGQLRIAAQLVDAEGGAHLWADRFDGSLQDVFELQDKVASSVAGVIEPALQAAEIAYCETALRLSPRGQIGVVYNTIGFNLLLSRRFEEAIPKLLLAIHDQPNQPSQYRMLAVCYAHLGRLDEARATIERLRAVAPVVVPDFGFVRKPEQRELCSRGLRLALGECE